MLTTESPKITQISIVFADTPDVIDSLVVEKTLSESDGSSVYEVHSPQSNTNYALKVFSMDSFGIEHYQKEKLIANFNHPNVIHYVPVINNNKDFLALVTEYAEFGNFLDILKADILNHEVLIRSYFHQLIDGLEYIHSQGVAHLDLKLENLMMGSDFLLKIIDFDQSQSITDSSITSGGTVEFRAPELKSRTATDLAAVDVFSTGIILYALLVKELPFLEDNDQESKNYFHSYSFFLNYNGEFWRSKIKRYGNKSLFSDEFIELINGMLSYDPKKRLRIEEIKNSKWYKGFVLDHENLKIAMKSRYESLKKP